MLPLALRQVAHGGLLDLAVGVEELDTLRERRGVRTVAPSTPCRVRNATSVASRTIDPPENLEAQSHSTMYN